MKKKKVELLFCRMDISMNDKLVMSPTNLDNYIKRTLASELADYVVANLDKLPVTVTKSVNVSTGTDTYELKTTLIDYEYLSNLVKESLKEGY